MRASSTLHARRRAAVAVSGAVTLLFLAACGSDELSYEGAHVTLHGERGGTVCAGTVPYLDEAYRLLSDYLRVPQARQRRVEYHFDPRSSLCGDDALGCAADDGRRVWARSADVVHELAHAVQHQATASNLHVFVAECLAGALEQPSGRWTDAADYARFDEALAWTLDATKRRDIAGDFCSYLLHVYGFERFSQLFELAPRDASVEALKRGLELVYAKPVDALLAERLSSGLFFPEARLGVSECWTAPLPWQGQQWSLQTSLHCSHAGVIGPVTLHPERDAWQNIRYAPFDVEQAGTYAVSVSSGSFSVDVAEPCAPIAFPALERQRIDSAAAGTTLAILDLAPGRHAFRLATRSAGAHGRDVAQDAGQLQVGVQLARVPVEDACVSGTVAVTRDIARLVLLGRPGRIPPSVSFTLSEPRLAKLSWYGVIGAEICYGACEQQRCQAFNTLGSATPELMLSAGSYAFRFRYANLPRGLASLTFEAP